MSFSFSIRTDNASASGTTSTGTAAATSGRSISGTTASRRRFQITKPAPRSASSAAMPPIGNQGRSSPLSSLVAGCAGGKGCGDGEAGDKIVALGSLAGSDGGGVGCASACGSTVSTVRGVTVGRGLACGACLVGTGRGSESWTGTDGAGAEDGVGVGVGVLTARGRISTPLWVSAGPCACGVALGLGAGSNEKSFTDWACAMAGKDATSAKMEMRVRRFMRFVSRIKPATVRRRAE